MNAYTRRNGNALAGATFAAIGLANVAVGRPWQRVMGAAIVAGSADFFITHGREVEKRRNVKQEARKVGTRYMVDANAEPGEVTHLRSMQQFEPLVVKGNADTIAAEMLYHLRRTGRRR